MPHSVVFLGTPHCAIPSLHALAADDRFTVKLVITQPSRPVGRRQLLTPPPIKLAADALGLPVIQTEKLNRDIAHLHSIPPFDFLVVVAFGQILSQEILDLPSIAPVNVHYSLLPRWRGASPVQHAIAVGDSETGVTIQKMVYELDAGAVLAQERMSIDTTDTTPTLMEKLSHLGADLLVRTLASPLHPTPQTKDGVTVCRSLTRENGVVDPTVMTAAEIERKIRAFTPFPGVALSLHNRSVKLLRASLTDVSETLALPCLDGTTLYVQELQEAGRKPMGATEWVRGIQ